MDSEIQNLKMPVAFIGHGSPMNALANNDYTQALNALGDRLPTPKAVVVVSAHWLTNGTFVTSTDTPKIIYDFGGFPDDLYKVKYPAPGSKHGAIKINHLLEHTRVQFDNGEWGLDHGTWSVMRHIYPKADVPLLQLSIDMSQPPEYHFNLGKQLQVLRENGFLIIGSGNIVHNLRNFSWKETDTPFDWAVAFDRWSKQQIESRHYKGLIYDFAKTTEGKMSVPSLDHYLPMLYILGASTPEDKLSFVYEKIQNGSIAMRSFIFE